MQADWRKPPRSGEPQITIEISLEVAARYGSGAGWTIWRGDPRCCWMGPRPTIGFVIGCRRATIMAVACGRAVPNPPSSRPPEGRYTGGRANAHRGCVLPNALRTDRTWGSGTTSLRELLDWTTSLGARTVSTLPLLRPSWISPSSPVRTRGQPAFARNGFYLDATAAPGCPLRRSTWPGGAPVVRRRAAALQRMTVD
jgi:hypothetical protein